MGGGALFEDGQALFAECDLQRPEHGEDNPKTDDEGMDHGRLPSCTESDGL